MANTIGKVAIGLGVSVGLYAICLGVLMTPPLQRFALYAHKFNTLFYHNINDAEQFGFAKNQVTPFNIHTPDGETLYAWHVLPLDTYVENEPSLRLESGTAKAPLADFTASKAFRLLISEPEARVVVSFHGNAGHVAQGWRTDTFRYMAAQPRTHVFTIDYRGFGHSTGAPTEGGLIQDGVTLVKWILEVTHISPERIVILGQSLGTAVASAVALEFAQPENLLHPARRSSGGGEGEEASLLSNGDTITKRTAFAGIVLVAPFSNLPSLLLTYRLGGVFPLLLPLRPFPSIAKTLTSQMVDKWPTADRLRAYFDAMAIHSGLLRGANDQSMGSVQLIHGVNDMDISYHQTEMICRRILGDGEKYVDGSQGDTVMEVKRNGRPGLRFEIFGHGAHNRIVTYSPVSAAVMRAFAGLI